MNFHACLSLYPYKETCHIGKTNLCGQPERISKEGFQKKGILSLSEIQITYWICFHFPAIETQSGCLETLIGAELT